MPFTIPNAIAAGGTEVSDTQAQIDKVDVDTLVAGLAGDGVASGCAVTAQGSPNMTVAVALGTVRIAAASVSVSAGNVTILAAHASLARFDLVVVNNAGTKSAVAGTAAAVPVFPAIPANSVVLAAVLVPATVTAIIVAHITDKRVIVTVPADATGDLAAHLADATDAHDASAVSFIPTGPIAATDVQAAIVEVASEAVAGTPVGILRRSAKYSSSSEFGDTTPLLLELNTVYYMPSRVSRSLTFDRIAAYVYTAAAAGGVVRFGIYAEAGTSDWPGALVLGGNTQASTALGLNAYTISQLLAAGQYWLAIVAQVAAATVTGAATFREQIPEVTPAPGGTSPTPRQMALTETGVSGALPSTANPSGSTGVGPILYLRPT